MCSLPRLEFFLEPNQRPNRQVYLTLSDTNSCQLCIWKHISTAPAMSSAGLNIEDLRLLVTRDLEASNELQARIDYIRKEVESGSKPTSGEVSELMCS